MTNIIIVTTVAITCTQRGEVLDITNQYMYFETGKTVHSYIEIEMSYNAVNNKTLNVPGGNNESLYLISNVFILTPHPAFHTLNIRPYTGTYCNTLPNVILARDSLWGHYNIVNNISQDDDWFKYHSDNTSEPLDPLLIIKVIITTYMLSICLT